jgi:RHS repeat-associated protein
MFLAFPLQWQLFLHYSTMFSMTNSITQWAYDSADQVTSMTYPDGEVVNYTYLTQRLVNSVGGNTYVQASLYDAAGRLIERRLGVDQLRTGYTYYPWSSDGGRLQYLKTGTPATYNGSNPSLQYFQYDYDNVGNVNWVRDHKATGAAQTHQFTYDALDRMWTASATNASGGTDGGLYSESYAYNANGLMTTGPLGAGYSYGNAAHKHAVTAVGSNSFTYDANGNMTGRTLAGSGASTLSYDAENRLVSVSGAASASFVYDGDNGRVKGSVNGATTTYVGSHYETEQVLCSGQTTAGSTNWQVESSTIIRVDVDTSACGLGSTPLYFSSLGGSSGHWLTVGATSIYVPTATGFRVYLRYADGGALAPVTANTNQWHIRWAAVGRETATSTLCSGRTAPGSTTWQAYGSNGVYLDVNTSRCGYSSPPVYLTSLGGNSSHFATTGATSIYVPTATGFRVYVRIVSGTNFTPADANSWGWHLNWLALPTNQTGSALCTGQTTSSGWVAYSSGGINGLYRDVSTSSCGNGSPPRYLTSLGGSSSHWGLLGMTSIYLPTATGFRVYIRDWSNSVLTPTQAQSNNWHVNWLAVTGSTTIVRKYYYAGNQRVAMRENGALRWLLGDHLGSTAYTVNGATEAGEVRYRAFGATRYASGITPTTYRYTGQREEAGLGLYYYGARWYDPSLGRFVQADTLVPGPGDPQAYDRYAYVLNNPLKYHDPSGYCDFAADILVTDDPMQCIGSAGASVVRRLGEAAGSLAVGLQLFAATQSPQAGSVAERAVYMADQAAHGASQSNAGNTAGPGGLDPNDPFRNASAAIRRGVETLRRQIESPTNYTTGRYGAQAHLSRAEYYQRQGMLQSVNPVGEGTIDLVLKNNTGVEVKYNQAQYVLRNIDRLADQLNNFKRLNLNQITVEFVQTQNNPVTQATLVELQQELTLAGADLSNIVFRIVANPGIP